MATAPKVAKWKKYAIEMANNLVLVSVKNAGEFSQNEKHQQLNSLGYIISEW